MRSPEELMNVLIASESSGRQRSVSRWLEVPFHIPGLLLAGVLHLLPWKMRIAADFWICGKMGGRTEPLSPETSDYIEKAKVLAQRVHTESRHRPAIFVFTTHPPTEGPNAWVRFHLLQHGLVISNRIEEALGEPLRPPQCTLAIDPYALDTVSVPVAGIYAGLIRGVFLAYDRQASTQTMAQRVLLSGTTYSKIVWRFLERLRRGVPILMMVGGGLPQNARLLHTCREFFRRLKGKAKDGRLAAEKQFLHCLTKPGDPDKPTIVGRISEARQKELKGIIAQAGLIVTEDQWIEFLKEFALDVPYRTRLFRILEKRLVRKGVPVILVGIRELEEKPYARLVGPWAWMANSEGNVQLISRGNLAEAAPSAEQLAKRVIVDLLGEAKSV